MTLFRQKLLFRLLVITFISAIVPLLAAGIYMISKSRSAARSAISSSLSRETLQVSNHFQQDVIFPLRQFVNTLSLELSGSEISVDDLITEFPSLNEKTTSVLVISEASNEVNTILGDPIFNSVKSSEELVSKLGRSNRIVFYVDFFNARNTNYLFCGRVLKQGLAILVAVPVNKISDNLQKYFRSLNLNGNLALLELDEKKTIFYETSDEGTTVFPFDAAFSKSNPQPLTTFEYTSLLEEKYLANYLDLPAMPNWRLVVEIPSDTAFLPAREIRNSFFVLLSIGLLFTFLGTYYYWKKITGPLDRFARSATEIARGDFTQKVQVDSEDEIGRLARIFNYMVFELRRLNEMNLNKIITEKTKTQAIVKNIADGVIVTDNYDRVVTLNSAIEKWLKVQETEAKEKPISMVIDMPSLSQFLEEMKKYEGDDTFTKELKFRLSGNSKDSIFQARATRIFSEEKFMGVVTILRDITHEKEIDRMKTELVSMVAHELRSPLASISGFAEILSSIGPTKEQVEEYANIIREEAERLAELVSKYLDLTKIEAGRMDFKPSFFAIKQVFDAMLYLVSTQAEKKNIELDIQYSNEDIEFYVDENMISEVIVNLLSNAIKYSPENSKILIEVSERSKNIQILVRDQGYGIDKHHLPHIFDKFYRIKDDSRIQEEKGTGLGLSLVKEIVELHDGTISVDSKINEGTTFRLILPRKDRTAVWQQ